METSDPGLPARRPTMADVAKVAGVSRALVSTVFRDVPGASAETRTRVLQAADDLGYRIDNRARLLRVSRTRLIGVTFRLRDPFHADLVQELYPRAEGAGYELVLSAVLPDLADRPESRSVGTLLDNRCEALLLVGPQLDDDELETLARRLPTVVLSRPTSAPSCETVRTDDAAIVAVALEHLHGLGHRDITHVDGGDAGGSAERRSAYEAQMADLGLAARCRVVRGGLGDADGRRAARAILELAPRPTAVITFDDAVAIALVLELRRAGVSVPEEISVVGHDDIQIAALPHIDLTTVGQDVPRTASSAVARAVARLDDGDTSTHDTLVDPYLAVRRTTAPPRMVV